MNLENKIKIIPRKKIVDSRGWFLKVIDGREDYLPQHTGEVYLIQAGPGQTRAKHYHKKTNEWFTLIQGKVALYLKDIHTNESLILELNSDEPTTVFVPSLIAHSFENRGRSSYILVAYSDSFYEPSDTVEYDKFNIQY